MGEEGMEAIVAGTKGEPDAMLVASSEAKHLFGLPTETSELPVWHRRWRNMGRRDSVLPCEGREWRLSIRRSIAARSDYPTRSLSFFWNASASRACALALPFLGHLTRSPVGGLFDDQEDGSGGASESRTFWDVSVTMAIPFSRWGAEPFVVAPIPFPQKVLEAARCLVSFPSHERNLHPFELALNWETELAADNSLTKARIAAREGISRARVTQIMNLLELPESIQIELRHPPKPFSIELFSERRLRLILSHRTSELQIRGWRAWLSELMNSP
jgi:hypothetical protein